MTEFWYLPLTLMQQIKLKLFGYVKLGTINQPHGQAPLYAFTCKLHGFQTGCPHGFKKELRCPECFKNEVEE